MEHEQLRATEYGYLDAGHHVYLDYGGAGLASSSQLGAHHDRLTGGLFGNPHSENPASVASTRQVESARRAVLRHLNASGDEYAVIFTPNATGACRLVGEAYDFGPERGLVLTADNHNSVVGLREFARGRGAPTARVPLRLPELRSSTASVVERLTGRGLLAYPAQSNFTGVQHPLDWIGLAHDHGYDVLLDAAAYLPTNQLDLAVHQPDFVAISWYKVFGYPTGVGCLVARREALSRLRRPWFSGGTIVAVSVEADWHWMTDDETAFEDGTVNFLSIPDVEVGLDWIASVGLNSIHERVCRLTGLMLGGLLNLRHGNGAPLVRVHGPSDGRARGGTVAFDVLAPSGAVVDERRVAGESAAAGISLRTGCFCNPGAGEGALAITGDRLRGSSDWGVRTIDEYLARVGLPTAGAVRASLGIASNEADVRGLLDFLTHTYTDRTVDVSGLAPRLRC